MVKNSAEVVEGTTFIFETHHIAEQSKLTKSHLCGLKLKESANYKDENNKNDIRA